MVYSSENYTKYTHPNPLYQYTLSRFLHRLYALFCQTQAQSVLEIGCGEGFVLDYLVKRKPELKYTGVDLNSEAVKMARRITAPGIDYVCANGEQIPLPDKRFDLVIMSEVLEHVATPENVLAEALRLGNPYVLVTVPLEPYFRGVSDLLVRLKLGHRPGHINFWADAGLRRWLTRRLRVAHYETCDLYQLALCTA
jgi:ubiquinone/menaquinone biosynthesis C-methylase UbiE